jgi:hypothetical protein
VAAWRRPWPERAALHDNNTAVPRTNPTLIQLRDLAIARTLFAPTTLPRAIARLGFVQMDPIRAPARAQDLMLRQRVRGYRAGELEARYPKLALEEDFFINYGVLPRATQRLMHPRSAFGKVWTASRWKQAEAVLEFVRARGSAHPDEVDAEFSHGRTKNWFGGNSRASTQLLDGMHYRGLVRIVRRDSGIRVYAAAPRHAEPEDAAATEACVDALIDVLLGCYAPLPERSLHEWVSRLRYGAPQWHAALRAALPRTKARLASAEIEGTRWYWPAGENPASRRHTHAAEDAGRVRLLAPFDPLVWDRRRFEAFWGWAYRFEAYVPAARRERGYYTLPLLWQGRVEAWANAGVRQGRLEVQTGHLSGTAPRDKAFRNAVRAEAQAMAEFLGLQAEAQVVFS